MRSKREQLELYIKQGRAYIQLLERTNPVKNRAKINKISRQIEQAAKKIKQLA